MLMLVTTDVAHDARVVREAAALSAAGHRVRVWGKDVPEEWSPSGGAFEVAGVSGGTGLRGGGATPGRSAMPSGGASPGGSAAAGGEGAGEAGRARDGLVWRAARWALLPEHRRRVWAEWSRETEAALSSEGAAYQVVHAHDFNTLPLAARLAERWGARLVYDSHEWWSGRQRHGRPTPRERLRERRVEAQLVRRADAVLTVSQGIAERLGRWTSSPVSVVRNTFPSVPRSGAAEVDTPRGVVYAGRIGGGRDLETVLAGAGGSLTTVLMGPADRAYVTRLGLDRTGARAELRPPLDGDRVDEVLRAYGISVVTLTDTCENHRMALPNKLFHAVRAGVPVVAADLPEIRRVVRGHGIGELYRPADPRSYRAAVERAVERYPELCAGVRDAAAELSWERDAERLVAVYEGLGR
ncbi:glycosyltransferase [Phaeacidiphilus oryzae]|uniref:glycosyltransferase n=1 Tax=Phaeacidiphilus oryzae TaxID=348818 RepID=UPI001F1BBCE0|nr:glycosyltransferase [Phaeacidiphilus oryzae]